MHFPVCRLLLLTLKELPRGPGALWSVTLQRLILEDSPGSPAPRGAVLWNLLRGQAILGQGGVTPKRKGFIGHPRLLPCPFPTARASHCWTAGRNPNVGQNTGYGPVVPFSPFSHTPRNYSFSKRDDESDRKWLRDPASPIPPLLWANTWSMTARVIFVHHDFLSTERTAWLSMAICRHCCINNNK